jgi:hypothetical protein
MHIKCQRQQIRSQSVQYSRNFYFSSWILRESVQKMSIADNCYSKEKALFPVIELHYRVNKEGRFYVWRTAQTDERVVHI